jgi:pilus assembly protein Flp/PilA
MQIKKIKSYSNKTIHISLIKNQKGQGLIEYLILVALIAVATIGVVKVVGNNMAKQYENINRAMGAPQSTQLRAENAAQGSLRQKDLSDFVTGSRTSGN